MAGRMLAALNFLTDLPGLHLYLRRQQIDQRRFSHTGRSCHSGCFSFQCCPQRFNALLLSGTDKKQWISAGSISIPQFLNFCLRSQIFFIKTDQRRHVLLFHHPVKNDPADSDSALAKFLRKSQVPDPHWQQPDEPVHFCGAEFLLTFPFFLFFINNINGHAISHQRVSSFF